MDKTGRGDVTARRAVFSCACGQHEMASADDVMEEIVCSFCESTEPDMWECDLCHYPYCTVCELDGVLSAYHGSRGDVCAMCVEGEEALSCASCHGVGDFRDYDVCARCSAFVCAYDECIIEHGLCMGVEDRARSRLRRS